MAKHIVDAVAWQEACNGIHCFDCPFMQGAFCKIKQYIESQPEADPTRQRATWIYHNGKSKSRECSSCGVWLNCDMPRNSFCPNCGADMRKEPAP